MAIAIERVSKQFDGVRALEGVTHDVPRGEVHVLLGPNGSGKSTLMRICAGVLVPDSGRVLVLGKEPYKDLDVKLRMGYAPQDSLLYEDLTGLENMYLYAGLQGVGRREARELYEELKDELELGEWFEKRRVKTYSGGMEKRASIAVALVGDPEVLILDEPTSGLDPEGRRKLWDFLLRLKHEGKTLLVATHLFEDAETLADEVVIVHRGRIAARGAVEELLSQTEYGYSVEVELARALGPELEERLEEIAGVRPVELGYTYRLYTNDPGLIEEVRKALQEAGLRPLRLELRKISLADVYFLKTGAVLE